MLSSEYFPADTQARLNVSLPGLERSRPDPGGCGAPDLSIFQGHTWQHRRRDQSGLSRTCRSGLPGLGRAGYFLRLRERCPKESTIIAAAFLALRSWLLPARPTRDDRFCESTIQQIGELPSLSGATEWLNSQPLTAAGCAGKSSSSCHRTSRPHRGLRQTLDWLKEDKRMQAHRARLTKACGSPQKYPLLGGAPLPATTAGIL
jgi:hypothetical protein